MPNASEYGDDSFTEERIQQSGILDDIKALGPNLGADALALMQEVMGKGKPYDDRSMVVCFNRIPVYEGTYSCFGITDGEGHEIDSLSTAKLQDAEEVVRHHHNDHVEHAPTPSPVLLR